MPNPPYSSSVLIIHENADGFAVDLLHWPDSVEAVAIPTRSLVASLLGSRLQQGITVLHEQRTAATRANLITKFTNFVNAKFPDTP